MESGQELSIQRRFAASGHPGYDYQSSSDEIGQNSHVYRGCAWSTVTSPRRQASHGTPLCRWQVKNYHLRARFGGTKRISAMTFCPLLMRTAFISSLSRQLYMKYRQTLHEKRNQFQNGRWIRSRINKWARLSYFKSISGWRFQSSTEEMVFARMSIAPCMKYRQMLQASSHGNDHGFRQSGRELSTERVWWFQDYRYYDYWSSSTSGGNKKRRIIATRRR